ncbi:MAG: hypothetical protein WCY09_08460 [Candidatus Omnitrophota bacterium]
MGDHITLDLIERVTVEELCRRHDVTVVVRERYRVPEGDSTRFFASLDRVEIKDGNFLISTHSSGATVEEAIRLLPKVYSNAILVVNAMLNTRREFGPYVILPEALA